MSHHSIGRWTRPAVPFPPIGCLVPPMEWLAGTLLVSSLALVAVIPAYAVEGENPWHPGLDAQPLYRQDQRLLISEPDSDLVIVPPEQVTVFFRRFEFDLDPSSLEVWVDNTEVTESLRFWTDRAWWQVPTGQFWTEGEHTVTARITDRSGSIFQDSKTCTMLPHWMLVNHPWPFEPTDEPNVVSNLMEDWQSFGSPSPPYWHGGLDIRNESGTEVHACAGGTVVKVVNYHPGDPLYWSVMVRDVFGFIWQYHHMELATITVSEGDPVSQGDVLGRIIEWPSIMNGASYHHLHLNVVRWLGGGPPKAPYVDGYEHWNPFYFFTPGTYTDALVPHVFDFWYTPNENSTVIASDSDAGTPTLSGDVDVVARMRDQMTPIGTLPGQPYEEGLYEVAYSVKPLAGGCSMAWIPRTRLGRFDKMPGGTIVKTQEAVLKTIYKEYMFQGATGFPCLFDYSQQKLYYSLTNTFLGVPDGPKGFWDTDQTSVLGAHFPDGLYRVTAYAKDYHGNETATSADVSVSNGLSWTGICPEMISAMAFAGHLSLDTAFGAGGECTQLGTLPVVFGPVSEGSVMAQVGAADWPVWSFDLPSLGMQVSIGVLAGNAATLEYVPLLGDVILNVPAEVQVSPLGAIGAPRAAALTATNGGAVGTRAGGRMGVPVSPLAFDPNAPSTNPVALRFSTRLARDPWSGAARIGRPEGLGQLTFQLVAAQAITVNNVPMMLHTGNGLGAQWILNTTGTPETDRPAPIPAELSLRAFPMPFRSELSVSVDLPEAGRAKVEIVDLQGRVVRQLANGELATGETAWTWDGRDASGSPVPAGVYFAWVRTDRHTAAQKVVRMR